MSMRSWRWTLVRLSRKPHIVSRVLPIRPNISFVLMQVITETFLFTGRNLNAIIVYMWSCGIMSVARCLARVKISSASFLEWVSYDFEHIIFVQVCMSICVGHLDSRPSLAFCTRCNFILSFVFKELWHPLFLFQGQKLRQIVMHGSKFEQISLSDYFVCGQQSSSLKKYI